MSRKRISAAEQGAAMRRQLDGQNGSNQGRSGDLYNRTGDDEIDENMGGPLKYKKGQGRLPGTLDHDKVHAVAMSNQYGRNQSRGNGAEMSRETSKRSRESKRYSSRGQYNDDYDRGASSRRRYPEDDHGHRRRSSTNKRHSSHPHRSSRHQRDHYPPPDKRSSRHYGNEPEPYYDEKEPRYDDRDVPNSPRRYDDRQFDSDRRRSLSRPTTAAAAINGRRATRRSHDRAYDDGGRRGEAYDDEELSDLPDEDRLDQDEQDDEPYFANRLSRSSRRPDRESYDRDYGTSRRKDSTRRRERGAAAAGAGAAAGALASRRRSARDYDDDDQDLRPRASKGRRAPQTSRRRAEPEDDLELPDEDEEPAAASPVSPTSPVESAQSPKSRRSFLPLAGGKREKQVKPKKSKKKLNGGAGVLQPFSDDEAQHPADVDDGLYSESEVGPRRTISRQSGATSQPPADQQDGNSKEKKGLLGGLAAGGLVGGLLGSNKKGKEEKEPQEPVSNEKSAYRAPPTQSARRAIPEESESEDAYNLDSESEAVSRIQSRRATPATQQRNKRSAAPPRERRNERFNEEEPVSQEKPRKDRRKKEAAAAAAVGVGAGGLFGGRLKNYSKAKRDSETNATADPDTRQQEEEAALSPSEDEDDDEIVSASESLGDEESALESEAAPRNNANREAPQPQPASQSRGGGLLGRLKGKKGAAAAGAGVGAGTAAAASSRNANRSGPAKGGVKVDPKGRVYPLTGIDNLALLMEDDGYQTVCFSVYLFKTQLDYETVLNFFERLADAYPKYRYVCELDPAAASGKDKQLRKGEPLSDKYSRFDPGRKTFYSKSLKAGGRLRPARWRIDEKFRMEENIQELDAQGEGSDADLFAVCDEVLSEHFNFNKPLWQAYLVHGLHTSEGARSALMIKIHHAFSDGQGMIQSYHSAVEAMQQGVSIEGKQSELDNAGAKAKSESEKRRTRNGRSKGEEEKPEQKKVGSRNIKPSMLGTVRHTWHTVRGLYFRRRKAFTYPKSAGKAAVKANGGKLGKNGRPSGRLYAHSEGIPMDDLKLIQRAFSTDKVNLSLNDVACAILSRALRLAAEDMAQFKGQRKVKDKRVAIFIPISKRPKGDWSLSNYTTGAIAWFRFHEPSQYGFEQLLLQVNREMNRIKQSYLPQLWFSIFNFVCKRRLLMAPNYPIARSIFQRAYQEYSVCTNVPGPVSPIYFGKHKAYSYHVLPPSSPGRATLAMGLISYGGEFSLAVSCDHIKDFEENDLPGLLCDAWLDSMTEILKVAKNKLKSV